MIERTLTAKIVALAQKFQVITLTGPRQAGKTTLVRAAFPGLPYASLEEPDVRQIALTDPRVFFPTILLGRSWTKYRTPLIYSPTSKGLSTRTVRCASS